MATKKFYLTSEGVQTCKRAWWQDPCSKHLHYTNIAQAKADEKIALAASAKKAKIETLKKGLRATSVTDSRMLHVFLLKTDDTVRNYAEAVDSVVPNAEWSKDMITSVGTYGLKNGSRNRVEVKIIRKPKVDEDTATVVGVWNISIDTTLGITLGREKVSKELSLDFDSDSAAENSLIEAREFFRQAVGLSGINYFEDANAALAERMLQRLKDMRDAIDSEYDGDFALWEQGRGYFVDSDYSNIVVNVDYKNTTFRDKNVERFFRDCLYTPEVQIKVTENNEKQGTSWSMERLAEGTWSVRTVMQDGTSQTSNPPTYDEMYSRVFWDFHDHVHINMYGESLKNPEEALKRAEYAKKLMIAVDEGIAGSKKRANEAWAEERRNKEARIKSYEESSKRLKRRF